MYTTSSQTKFRIGVHAEALGSQRFSELNALFSYPQRTLRLRVKLLSPVGAEPLSTLSFAF
jgi:hypothetical protein